MKRSKKTKRKKSISRLASQESKPEQAPQTARLRPSTGTKRHHVRRRSLSDPALDKSKIIAKIREFKPGEPEKQEKEYKGEKGEETEIEPSPVTLPPRKKDPLSEYTTVERTRESFDGSEDAKSLSNSESDSSETLDSSHSHIDNATIPEIEDEEPEFVLIKYSISEVADALARFVFFVQMDHFHQLELIDLKESLKDLGESVAPMMAKVKVCFPSPLSFDCVFC